MTKLGPDKRSLEREVAPAAQSEPRRVLPAPEKALDTERKKLMDTFSTGTKEITTLVQRAAEEVQCAHAVRSLRQHLEVETKRMRTALERSSLTQEKRHELLQPFRAHLAKILVQEARAFALAGMSSEAFTGAQSSKAWLTRHYAEEKDALASLASLEGSLRQGSFKATLFNAAAEWSRSGLGETVAWSVGGVALVGVAVAAGAVALPAAGAIAAGIVVGGVALGVKNLFTGWRKVSDGFASGYTRREGTLERTVDCVATLSDLIPGATLTSKLSSRTIRGMLKGAAQSELRDLAERAAKSGIGRLSEASSEAIMLSVEKDSVAAALRQKTVTGVEKKLYREILTEAERNGGAILLDGRRLETLSKRAAALHLGDEGKTAGRLALANLGLAGASTGNGVYDIYHSAEGTTAEKMALAASTLQDAGKNLALSLLWGKVAGAAQQITLPKLSLPELKHPGFSVSEHIEGPPQSLFSPRSRLFFPADAREPSLATVIGPAASSKRGNDALNAKTPGALADFINQIRTGRGELSEAEHIGLEQALQRGTITSVEVRRIASERMSPSQRGALCEFAIRFLNPESHRDLIADTWQDMTWEEQVRSRAHLITEQPKSVYLLAATDGDLTLRLPQNSPPPEATRGERPHEARQRLAREKPHAGFREKPRPTSILDDLFSHRDRLDWTLSRHLAEGSSMSSKVSKTIDFALDQKFQLALLPHLPRIAARYPELAPKCRQVLESLQLMPYLDPAFVSTAKERATVASLEAHAKRLEEERGEPFSSYHNWPQNLRKTLEEIVTAQESRLAEHLFSDAAGLQALSRGRLGFARLIGSVAQGNLPVGKLFAANNFTKEEVRTVTHIVQQAGDITNILCDPAVVRHLASIGNADFVVREIVSELTGWGDLFDSPRVLKALPEILRALPEKGREQVASTITIHAPHTWLKNPAAMAEYGKLTHRALVNALAESPHQFARYYPKLIQLVKQGHYNRAAETVTEGGLRALGISVAERHPEILLDRNFARQLFSESDYQIRLRVLVERGNSETLRLVLHNVAKTPEHYQALSPAISRRLLSDPETVHDLLVDNCSWDDISRHLTARQQEQLVLSVATRDQTNTTLENNDFTSAIIARPKLLKRFLYEAERAGNFHAILRLGEGVLMSTLPSGETSATRLRARQLCEGPLNRMATQFPLESLQYKIIPALRPDIRAIVREHIPAATRISPELIEQIKPRFPELNWEAIERPYLLHNNLRDGFLISGASFNLGSATHPLSRILAHGEDEIYDRIQSRLETLPVFAAFRADYRDLVEKVRNVLGNQHTIDSTLSIDDDVSKLIENISYLHHSPIVERFLPEILNRSPAEQRQIFADCRRAIELGEAPDPAVRTLDEGLTDLSQKVSVRYREKLGLNPEQAETFRNLPHDLQTALGTHAAHYNAKAAGLLPRIRTLLDWSREERFAENRAWGEPPPLSADEKLVRLQTMKTQGLLPQKLSLDQYETFLRDEQGRLTHSLSYSPEEMLSTTRTLLLQAVADGHVPREQISENVQQASHAYDRLFAPIADIGAERNKLAVEIRKRKSLKEDVSQLESRFSAITAQQRDYLEENKAEISSTKARMYLAVLRAAPIHTLEQGKVPVNGKLVSTRELFSHLKEYYSREYPDFRQDLTNIERIFSDATAAVRGKRRVSRETLTLTDRVDLRTHFLIGAYPVESCQHYRSTSRLGGGLLAYVLDPNVKIVQAYDEQGTITARAVLRLLEDSKGNPTLFLERVYSHNPSDILRHEMVAFARRKAESMGVRLFTHGCEHDTESLPVGEVTTLFSRASRHTGVYTDAGGGLMHRGEYSIKRAVEILAGKLPDKKGETVLGHGQKPWKHRVVWKRRS